MLLSAMPVPTSAWDQVSMGTIAKHFWQYDFRVASPEVTADLELSPEGIQQMLKHASFDNYVNTDSNAAVCGHVADNIELASREPLQVMRTKRSTWVAICARGYRGA